MKKIYKHDPGAEKSSSTALVPAEIIENRILLIRSQKVMISSHLALLYGVRTIALNQAVKRNIDRFPADFAFRLNRSEADLLVSQNVIPHIKYFGGSFPYAFTEQGIAMLSSILRSKRAVRMNIAIMRIFVKLRKLISTHKELEQKLYELEHKIGRIDEDIITIFNAIRRLIKEEERPKNKIGFV